VVVVELETLAVKRPYLAVLVAGAHTITEPPLLALPVRVVAEETAV
jgi:hypothetical protein